MSRSYSAFVPTSRDDAEVEIARKLRLVQQGDGEAVRDLFEIVLHSLDQLNKRTADLERRKSG